MRRCCHFEGLRVGDPSNDGSPDTEKVPEWTSHGPREGTTVIAFPKETGLSGFRRYLHTDSLVKQNLGVASPDTTP
jgi:hypothetical protein